MPIYEYACRECGHRSEYLVLPTSPAAECPSCHRSDLEQQISLSSVSSASSRQANLSAAHRKAAGIRNEKSHSEHRQLHEHFDD
jgi:putative FmdB family regulatory protein